MTKEELEKAKSKARLKIADAVRELNESTSLSVSSVRVDFVSNIKLTGEIDNIISEVKFEFN